MFKEALVATMANLCKILGHCLERSRITSIDRPKVYNFSGKFRVIFTGKLFGINRIELLQVMLI